MNNITTSHPIHSNYYYVDNHKNILEFIKIIRESFVGSEIVYTKGSCYHFYKILKQVFPEALPYYNIEHVITRIGNRFYDINGEITNFSKYEILDEVSDDLNKPYNLYTQWK